MKRCCSSGFSLLQWTYSAKWRLIMKKGKIIQDIKQTHLCQFLFLHYSMYFSLPLYRRGLWFCSELVGPFSIVIGFLIEFFSPGNGACKKFFYHYLLYYELFSFVIIYFTLFFWVKVIEKNALSSLGFVKKKLAQVSSLGIMISLFKWEWSRLSTKWVASGLCVKWAKFRALPAFILGLFPLRRGGTEVATRVVSTRLLQELICLSNRDFCSLFGILHMGNAGVTFLSVLNIILDGVLAGLFFYLYG